MGRRSCSSEKEDAARVGLLNWGRWRLGSMTWDGILQASRPYNVLGTNLDNSTVPQLPGIKAKLRILRKRWSVEGVNMTNQSNFTRRNLCIHDNRAKGRQRKKRNLVRVSFQSQHFWIRTSRFDKPSANPTKLVREMFNSPNKTAQKMCNLMRLGLYELQTSKSLVIKGNHQNKTRNSAEHSRN